jgi:cytochrome c oxidase cbb3-type subunit 3
MWVKSGSVAAVLLGLIVATCLNAQVPPVAGSGQNGVRRAGGFVPGQQRPAGDPVQIARGKTLYGIDCTGCHGVDLRGGDLGGPNLLRSQLALSDQDGELILPIIQGSRQSQGMPAIEMSREDGLAVAAYVRSVVATIGRQGMPPSVGQEPPSVLVGDARAGQSYFDSKCGGCHSPTGDMRGIASRIPDPKALQNRWVAGGGGRRGGAGTHPVTVTVTQPSGESVDGRLVRIDDFLVTIALPDGTMHTFRREGDVPKVDVHDPMRAHRDLLAVYTDQDMHNVTAYLVTLK